MNEIKRLASEIRRTLPRATVRPDCPTDDRGQACWLDVELAGRSVTVEWRPGRGFGVSSAETSAEDAVAGLFNQPNRVVETWNEAFYAVLTLLGHRRDDPDLMLAAASPIR